MDFIKYLFPYFKSEWRNYPDIEELISLMDVYIEFSEKIKRKHSFSTDELFDLKADLLRAIGVYLSDRSFLKEIEKSHLFRLVRTLKPGDVIITFNWDLLVEKALRKLRIVWHYDLIDNRISLLKPHGSIDWFDSKKVHLRKATSFRLMGEIGRIRVFNYFRFPETEKRVAPVIIPPTVKKKWPYREFSVIWRAVWKALRHADEINILGFSLPPEDLHVRFVMRSAIRANEEARQSPLTINLVNPDKSVFLRFSRLARTRINYFEAGLENVSMEELVKPG